MRKITQQSVNAFIAKRNFSSGNMTVHNHGQVTEMRLHGNLIAEHVHITGEIFISNAGWTSNTTKERLNGILDAIGEGSGGIYQRDFQWYWKGSESFPDHTMVYAGKV